jgi:hypothetical protein
MADFAQDFGWAGEIREFGEDAVLVAVFVAAPPRRRHLV